MEYILLMIWTNVLRLRKCFTLPSVKTWKTYLSNSWILQNITSISLELEQRRDDGPLCCISKPLQYKVEGWHILTLSCEVEGSLLSIFAFPAPPELNQKAVDNCLGVGCGANPIRADSLLDGHDLWRRRSSVGPGWAAWIFHTPGRRSWARQLPSPTSGVSGHRRRDHRQRQGCRVTENRCWRYKSMGPFKFEVDSSLDFRMAILIKISASNENKLRMTCEKHSI